MAEASPKEYAKDPVAALRKMSAFSALSDRSIEKLEHQISWVELKPGERLSRRLNNSKESYYFLQEGQVAVILDHAHASGVDAPSSNELSELKKDWEFLSFFTPGDFFADGYASTKIGDDGSRIDCVGYKASVLATLSKDFLKELTRKHRPLGERLKRRNKRLRRHYREHRPSSRRLVQDFFLRHGYSFAKTMRVLQLDRCIACDACETACRDRHGVTRFSRIGPVLGGLAFPIACRTCVDARCLAACGFDALTRADSGELTIDQMKCVGCTACQTNCPNDVIEMVEAPFTVKDFPRPLPNTNNDGLTNVEGLYLIGEASGSALIKVAINGGVKAVEAIFQTNRDSKPKRGKKITDVIIVGAGPGGLSASLACREHHLSFKVFDKGTFATTIQNFPRHKMVMAEPAHIPLFGTLWLKDTTKEELIEKWQEVIAKTQLIINSDEEVTAVTTQDDGTFEVATKKGNYRSRNVVLAVGTRGSPRKVGAEGENDERVKYVLVDPAAYAGKRILVVGGGDSAVEAAMSLADEEGTRVTLSYRRDEFGRIKPRNKTRLKEYEKSGKLKIAMKSTVPKLTPQKALLKVDGQKKSVKNDIVFAMLGAEPPTKFFEACGIEIIQPNTEEMAQLAASRGNRFYANKCDHCVSHKDQACMTACPTEALVEISPKEIFVDPDDAQAMPVFNELPFLIGLDKFLGRKRGYYWAMGAAIAALFVAIGVGFEVLLRAKAPDLSIQQRWFNHTGNELSVFFSSGRGLGLTLGYTGAGLMLFAGLYPLQSHLGRLKGLGKKRVWMASHIWAGILGPIFITYHTGLKLDRWPSLAFWSMWLVVLTGIAGRYIQTWFQRGAGLVDLEVRSLEDEQKRLFDQFKGVEGRTQIFKVAEALSVVREYPTILAPLMLFWMETSAWLDRLWFKHVSLRAVPDRKLKERALRHFTERARTARRRYFADAVTRSWKFWKRVHFWVTTAMFTIVAIHITFALLYKAE